MSATQALRPAARGYKRTALTGRNVYKPAWREDFPWLRTWPTVLDDGNQQQPEYLFCLYCSLYEGLNNGDKLSTRQCSGSSIRQDNLRTHHLSGSASDQQKGHARCVERYEQDHGKVSTIESAMHGSHLLLARLLRTVLTAVLTESASVGSLVKRLVSLQRTNGCIVPTAYTSATANTESGGIHSFMNAATLFLLDGQSTDMRAGGMFSTMGDGSTNVAHRELESMAVRYPHRLHGILDYKSTGLNGVRVRAEFYAIVDIDVLQSRDKKSFDSQALMCAYDTEFVRRGLATPAPEPEPESTVAEDDMPPLGGPSRSTLYVPVPGVSGMRVATAAAAVSDETSSDLAKIPALQISRNASAFYPSRHVSQSTDGASVNVGRLTGLNTLMRERIPHLVTTHGVAHVVELAVKDAIEGIAEAEDVLKVNQAVVVEYNVSAKKLLSVESVAKKMSGPDAKFTKLHSRHGIRWQESVHRGTRGVIDNWMFIATDLYQRACDKVGVGLTLLSSPELFIGQRVATLFEDEDGEKKKHVGRVRQHEKTLENGEPVFTVFFRHDASEVEMTRSELVPALKEQDVELREKFLATTEGDLFNKITQYLHVQLTYFFADTTMVLKHISKVFQSDSLHIHKLRRTLARRLVELEALKVDPGPFMRAFISDFDPELEVFHKIELQGVAEGKAAFPAIRDSTVNALSSEMHARFDPFLADPVLDASEVFDHSEWPAAGDERNSYGNDKIAFLLQHFEVLFGHLEVDIVKAALEWVRLKEKVMCSQILRSMKYDDLYENLFDHHSSPADDEEFFNILMLVLCIHVIALDTSICERLFSRMNRLQSKVRNRMGLMLLQMSMTICELGSAWKNGPSLIPVDAILAIWKEGKKNGRYENKALWSCESLLAMERISSASVLEMQDEGLASATVVPDVPSMHASSIGM